MSYLFTNTTFRPDSILALLLLVLHYGGCTSQAQFPTPNVILIYADDLGYGDLGCYGATELKTPHLDELASNGLRFTNAYATSATCTPSRYALLTGEYPWRNTDAKVLPGNAPLIIDTARRTLPDLFQNGGYTTAIIGKWHLGLGDEEMDWNRKIIPGPRACGFDYSYILASTNDRVPTVYVENETVVGLKATDPLEVSYLENFPGEPTGKEHPEQLKIHPSQGHDMSIHNGISRIGYMRGGKSALWTDEEMADTLLGRSLTFIEKHSEQPFFLYYSLPQPHVPRTPHPRFVGATDLGPRGDVIMEIDYAVGKIMACLDSLGLMENTLVIFSSDNGPVLDDGYHDESEVRIGTHQPNGSLRGGKYSLYDAGTHIPFIVHWRKNITPGVSSALVCQIDLHRTLSALIGQKSNSIDSKNVLSALLGKSDTARTDLVLEALGRTWYRHKNWALIPPYAGPKMVPWGVKIETGRSTDYQLFDLANDPGQTLNLANERKELLQELIAKYKARIAGKINN